MSEASERHRLGIEWIYDVKARVAAAGRDVARGRASGVEIDGRWGYLITVANRQIVRVEAYRDAALALQMAGLGQSEVGTDG